MTRRVLGSARSALVLSAFTALCQFAAPPAEAAVGRTPGSFSVSPSGAATYSIPIFSPPGPNGLQPSVSLNYNSNGSIGTIGRGWSLSYGSSAISRCNKTVAQDGRAVGVGVWDWGTGGYCLDGNRLRLQSGLYGADDSVYATEIADFSRITAVDTIGFGPSSWIVERKDGLIYTYGGTSESRILINAGTYYGPVSTVSVWRLSEIKDRSGNKIAFSYKEPDSTTAGTTHLEAISWTRTSLSSTTYVYSMEFAYGSGSNADSTSPTGYVADNTVHDTDLLNSISVKQAGTTVRKYVLEYETSPTTLGKRLETITECSDAAESDCLAPTEIGYQDGQVGIASSASHTISGSNFGGAIGSYDFDGNGLRDLLYYRGGAWYARLATISGYDVEISTGLSSSLLGGDPFGSGRDVFMATNSGSWTAFVWNGSSFTQVNTGISTYNSASIVSLADVNGDGRDDMVYVKEIADGMLKIGTRLSTATGSTLSFESEQIAGFIPTPPAEGGYLVSGDAWVQYDDAYSLRLGDLDTNGDGRDEVFVDGQVLYCWDDPYYDCWGYQFNSVLRPAYDTDMIYYEPGLVRMAEVDNLYGQLFAADLNSDNCTDLVLMWGTSITHSGCESGFSGVNASGSVVGVIDWDGDGRQDVLVQRYGYSTLYVQRSTGGGLASPVDTGLPLSCHAFVTDANGDGLEDLGCWHYSYPSGSGNIEIFLHNGATVLPDRAMTFADGYGESNRITVNYAISTHDGYEPYTNASYPQRDINRDMVLVRTVEAPDGAGGTFTTTYSYFGATEDVVGRGFQGFERIESVDSRNLIKRVQRFRRDFPYTGMLIEEEVRQSSGTPIRLRVTTPGLDTLNAVSFSQRYFPYASVMTEDTYEVEGPSDGDWVTRTVVSNTFGDWGNLTASTKTVTDKDSASSAYGLYNQTWTTTSTASFSPSITYWCLGLPISSSTTSSSPLSGEPSVTVSKTYTPDYVNCRMDEENIGSGNRQVDTYYGYDDFGNVDEISVQGRNPNGSMMSARTTHITWGSANGTSPGTGQFPVSETNALSQTATRTFHSTFGSLLAHTDANGIVVASNTYDSFGRPTRTTRTDGTSTVFAYDPCATHGCLNGDPSSGATGIDKLVVVASERDTSDAPIRDSYSHYDAFDRLIVEQSRNLSGSSGGYTRVGRQYDEFGRVSRETVPCDNASCTVYWTTNTYDLIGRIKSQSRRESQSSSTPVTTTITYAGRSQSVTDPNGKVSTKILDVNGWTRQSIDHDGYYQSFSYDGAGSLVEVSDSLTNPLFSASYTYGIKAFQDETVDMDMGEWTYTRNSLGELVEWRDANTKALSQTKTASQTFDALSRLTSRTEAEGTTTWTWGTSAGNFNIGRLAGVSMSDNTPTVLYSESLTYDNKGRPSTQTVTTDQSYAIDYDYTNQGLLDTLTYPTSIPGVRVKLKYGYNFGVLVTVRDFTGDTPGTYYWTLMDENVRGQPTQEVFGNGVVTNRSFDAVSGRLNSIQSGVSGGTGLQNQSYMYDLVGNVIQRMEGGLGVAVTENACYDDLHRLVYTEIGSNPSPTCSSPSVSIEYDPMGNIIKRSDVNGNATWTYHGTKKHAVATTGPGGASYGYDDNGNMTSRDGSSITWSSFNYPTALSTATENTTLSYGPNRQYYKQVYTGPASSTGYEETHYVGGILEKVNNGTTTDWRHYIKAGGKTVAIVSRKSSSANAVYYPLEDNQGSGSHLTNSNGASIARQSYDAFGLPRDGNDWQGAVPGGDQTAINGISRRGFTGHSMLGAMGLIHMNGRVQDAITGRFLSPDPNVPYPELTQSFNRYAYVRNNPLTLVDPSGFCDTAEWQGQTYQCLQEVIVTGVEGVCADLSGDLQSLCVGFSNWVDSLSISERNCLVYGGLGCGSGQHLAMQDMNDVLDSRETLLGLPGPQARGRQVRSPTGVPGTAPQGRGPPREEPLQGMGTVLANAIIEGVKELGRFNERTATCRDCITGSPDLLGGPAGAARALSIGAKIEAQMAPRGWTLELIEDATRYPARTVATRDARHLAGGGRMDDAATAYYSQQGGYVVRNDRTGDIVQVSNRNDPAWRAPWD